MENRRQFVRMQLPTTAYTMVEGKVVRARILNISRGGVFLELNGAPQDALPETGRSAVVAFDLPRNPVFSLRSLNCKGVVVRAMGEPGHPSHVAIEFTSLRIRAGAASNCVQTTRPSISELHAGIHLVCTTSQSNHEDDIPMESRMRHRGA